MINNVGETVCDHCERKYGDESGFCDLVVPHEVWDKISPRGDSGGLLCPSCMCESVYLAGIECQAQFKSGPFVDEWRDIETAPKDQSFLAMDEDWNIYRCKYSHYDPDLGLTYYDAYCGQPVVQSPEPILWKPLPVDIKAESDPEIIWCDCGDGFPVGSYGHGFMDAAGECENCHFSRSKDND